MCKLLINVEELSKHKISIHTKLPSYYSSFIRYRFQKKYVLFCSGIFISYEYSFPGVLYALEQ
jgi:hypothetical protein